jgi:hypothetical protein
MGDGRRVSLGDGERGVDTTTRPSALIHPLHQVYPYHSDDHETHHTHIHPDHHHHHHQQQLTYPHYLDDVQDAQDTEDDERLVKVISSVIDSTDDLIGLPMRIAQLQLPPRSASTPPGAVSFGSGVGHRSTSHRGHTGGAGAGTGTGGRSSEAMGGMAISTMEMDAVELQAQQQRRAYLAAAAAGSLGGVTADMVMQMRALQLAEVKLLFFVLFFVGVVVCLFFVSFFFGFWFFFLGAVYLFCVTDDFSILTQNRVFLKNFITGRRGRIFLLW